MEPVQMGMNGSKGVIKRLHMMGLQRCSLRMHNFMLRVM